MKITMNENCRFLKDLESGSHMGGYNLITSLGALRLFNKGIKPSRNWTLKSVKNYFGLVGNKESILNQLETLHDICNNKK